MVESTNGDHTLFTVIIHLADIQHSVILNFKLAFHINLHYLFADCTSKRLAYFFQQIGVFSIVLSLLDSFHDFFGQFVDMLFLFRTGEQHDAC